MTFSGLLAYPITPLDARGGVDHAVLFDHVAQLCESPRPMDGTATGPDGVVVLGTSGSFAYLDREERRAVVETACNAAAGTGVPVAAGISAMTTREVLALAHDAEEAGADGLVLNALSYVPLTSPEVAHQVETVAQAVAAPLCLYNNPGTTGFDMPVSLAADLASLGPVVAFKDTAPNAAEFARRREVLTASTAPGDRLAHGLSSARLMLDSLAPADAWHSGLIAFFPREFRVLFEAARRRQRGERPDETTRGLQSRLSALNAVIMKLRPISGLHALARELGLSTAPPRLPLLPVDAAGRERLVEVLRPLRG